MYFLLNLLHVSYSLQSVLVCVFSLTVDKLTFNQMEFLLRKIALPYPHKCLFGFVEQKRIDRQEFFKEYSCHKR